MVLCIYQRSYKTGDDRDYKKKKMGKFESEQTLIKVKNTQFDEFKFHQQTHLS
jgi:hypothetical protein